ncbi:MAG: zinc-ribbon domain-containing protein [Eubacteriales bacterium]|nr:zinc-ribbon domain-containing protein [Eubacteriales bacterium]
MAFLESLGESISHAGSAISQRANDFTLQNQLKHSIEQCQQRIDSDYRTLGTMVYMERKQMSQEPMNYDQVIRDIDDTTVYMNGQIAQYDQLRGVVRCPNCGAEVAVGTPYCMRCGAPIAAAQQGMGPQYAGQPYAQQPVDQPQGQPYMQQPMDQTQGQSYEQQPVDQPQGQPYEQQPMDQQQDQPQPEGQTQPVNQPAEPYAQQPMEQAQDQPADQPQDQPSADPVSDAQNICPSCGKPYKPGTRFCTRCGASLVRTENEQK